MRQATTFTAFVTTAVVLGTIAECGLCHGDPKREQDAWSRRHKVAHDDIAATRTKTTTTNQNRRPTHVGRQRNLKGLGEYTLTSFQHDEDELVVHPSVVELTDQLDEQIDDARKRATNDDNNNATTAAKLRRDWTKFEHLSDEAADILDHQSDCSLPLVSYQPRDNHPGLGSDILFYKDGLCNGMWYGNRIVTSRPWIWRDETSCDPDDLSAISCYFPLAEDRCGSEPVPPPDLEGNIVAGQSECKGFVPWRETTEFLFSSVSPLVIREAERQLAVVFPNGIVPKDLITVHIRWGDKKMEMDLVGIDLYIDAVKSVQERRNLDVVNIFLSTYDAEAVTQFNERAPKDWNVYLDAFFYEMNNNAVVGDANQEGGGERRNSHHHSDHSYVAEETRGRLGLNALGSLLVAMEANYYVLTLESNWSQLMNHIRKSILEKECRKCTLLVNMNGW